MIKFCLVPKISNKSASLNHPDTDDANEHHYQSKSSNPIYILYDVVPVCLIDQSEH